MFSILSIISSCQNLRYKSVKDLILAFCQRGVFEGACSKHESMLWLDKKFEKAEIDFKSWPVPNKFFKQTL